MKSGFLLVFSSFIASSSSSQEDQACGTSPGQSAVPHAEGNFTFPNASSPVFPSGSSMNISWTTSFASSTLWLISGCDFAVPTANLAQGLSASYFVWEVETTSTNSSQLYSFRVVDTAASDESQRTGGFWSAVFYIYNGTTPSSSLSGTSTAITLVSPASETTQPSSTSPYLLTTTTDLASLTSSTFTILSSDHATSAKAGIGVGVTLGIIGLAGIAAGGWVWRKRQAQAQDREASTDPRNKVERTPPPLLSHDHSKVRTTNGTELYVCANGEPGPIYEIG